MKNIDSPAHVEPDNFKRFLKYKSEAVKAKLQNILDVLPEYYNTYHDSCPHCHLIENDPLEENITTDIINLYESYKTKEVKKYRDELFELSLKCPYCSLNETQTLDHYLPKSSFPEYALFSLNLIPVCYTCNSTYKGDDYRDGEERLYIHPYIDEINDIEVLVANMESIGGSIRLNFNVEIPAGFDPELAVVVGNHFNSLNLSRRYTKYGLDYLSNMSASFRSELINGELVDSITAKYDDSILENGRNHWKSAMLRALVVDLNPLISSLRSHV